MVETKACGRIPAREKRILEDGDAALQPMAINGLKGNTTAIVRRCSAATG
jgi:hypothetical protein